MSESLEFVVFQPWPWWIGGPLIGIIAILLALSTRKQLGISSSYQYICSRVLPLKNDYLRADTSAFSWQFTFVAGMIGGGLLLSLLPGEINIALSDGAVEKLGEIGLTDLSGYVPAALYNFSGPSIAILFIGGIATGFGARYANGCTAGHAIAGCAQLAPASLIATICFFVGGLIATYFIVPEIFLI